MDLRQLELNKNITEYGNKVKVAEYDLRDYKQTLKTLIAELKIHNEGKQKELDL